MRFLVVVLLVSAAVAMAGCFSTEQGTGTLRFFVMRSGVGNETVFLSKLEITAFTMNLRNANNLIAHFELSPAPQVNLLRDGPGGVLLWEGVVNASTYTRIGTRISPVSAAWDDGHEVEPPITVLNDFLFAETPFLVDRDRVTEFRMDTWVNRDPELGDRLFLDGRAESSEARITG
ncbi:MAG: hypothetical protein ACT4PT_02275 [Methanobacteriota archaeon]